MIQKFAPAVLFFTLAFAFQSFDIPPLRGAANPKTCCGRTVCLCKHAKGSLCPFKHKPEAVSKSCHLSAKTRIGTPQSSSQDAVSWTKAPCHSDAPKYISAGFFKDGVLPESVISFSVEKHNPVFASLFELRGLFRDLGIERPPRIPFFPF